MEITRCVQLLAKAAIRTGIQLLLETNGFTEEQIEYVVIAGSFGSYIDLSSAVTVGLLPPLSLDCLHQVGNAAGIGAKLALLSRRCRGVSEEIARRVEYIELTTDSRFSDAYMSAMGFPDPSEVDV